MKNYIEENKVALTSLRLTLQENDSALDLLDRIGKIEEVNISDFYTGYVSKLTPEQLENTISIMFKLCEYSIGINIQDEESVLGYMIGDLANDTGLFLSVQILMDSGTTLTEIGLYDNLSGSSAAEFPEQVLCETIGEYMTATGKEILGLKIVGGVVTLDGNRVCSSDEIEMVDLINSDFYCPDSCGERIVYSLNSKDGEAGTVLSDSDDPDYCGDEFDYGHEMQGHRDDYDGYDMYDAEWK